MDWGTEKRQYLAPPPQIKAEASFLMAFCPSKATYPAWNPANLLPQLLPEILLPFPTISFPGQ